MSATAGGAVDGLAEGPPPGWRAVRSGWADAALTSGERVLLRDLTMARRLEAALAERMVPLQEAFAQAPIAMLVASVDGGYAGRLLLANPALCRLTGYTPAELLAASVSDLARPEPYDVYPESLADIPAGRVEAYDEVRHWVHADGHDLLVRVSASPVRRLDGTVRHVVAQVQDITAVRRTVESLRRNEERFRRAFTSAPAALLLLDLGSEPPGRLAGVTRELCRRTGHGEAELLGMEYAGLLHTCEPPTALDWLPAMHAGALPRYEADTFLRHAVGYRLRAHVVITPVGTGDDPPREAIAHITDLAEDSLNPS